MQDTASDGNEACVGPSWRAGETWFKILAQTGRETGLSSTTMFCLFSYFAYTKHCMKHVFDDFSI